MPLMRNAADGAASTIRASCGALAAAAAEILASRGLREKMSREGIERLGNPGALDHVVEHTTTALGWETRMRVYRRLRSLGWEEIQ